MQFLLDMGAAPRTAAMLRDQGHDAVHLRELGMQQAHDEDILAMSAAQHRVLITFDLDFSRLLALRSLARPSVILYRLERYTTEVINQSLLTLIRDHEEALDAGAILLVEPTRVRVRLLPIL